MRTDLAQALAATFLAGEWTTTEIVHSGVTVVGHRRRWLPALARHVVALYPSAPLDRPRELAAVITAHPVTDRTAWSKPLVHLVPPTRMVHNPWHLPALHDLADLATFLHLTQPELAWFADPRHWARITDDAPLQHYRSTTRTAPSGAIRVLEAPKPRLKALQRRLLAEVFAQIPTHDAAHGFRIGRSVAGYAAPHAGQAVVIRLDLEGFFAAVTVGRSYGVLRAAGYPEPVAHALAGLATTVLPLRAWQSLPRPANPRLLDAHWRLGRRLAAPHLPQGAPTSPVLANLAAYRLDVRLTALAESWGGRYTRYDDLAFSGGRSWRAGTSRLLDVIEEIIRDEGFRLNERKTAVLPLAGRQVLGGLVVNDRPHVGRAEVDRLRAILHNCRQYGPSTQNLDGHSDFRAQLLGRVAWVAQHDTARGERLRAQLGMIDWSR